MPIRPSPIPARAWVGALRLGVAGLSLATLAATAADGSAARCEARSPTQRQTVVELYTSEGCNSCPPADKFLSSLKGRPGVLAAAFHVDYWDKLGWVDRFASPRYTRRQAERQAHTGARFNYTPQVLANGRDWRAWPGMPEPDPSASVQIRLQRQSTTRLVAEVTPLAGAPARLGLWWARLEDGHVSPVRAGENAGVTLRHDHVVREYAELPVWANDGAHSWTIDALPQVSPNPAPNSAPTTAATATGRPAASRWLVVVTDGVSGAPLQALELGC